MVPQRLPSDRTFRYFTQFCITRSVIDKGQTGSHLIRDYSHFSEENYLNDLSQVDWARVVPEVETDVDKLFSRFYNKLNKLMHAALKPISKRKSKMFSKPWITRGLRKSIRIKNKLLYHWEIKINTNTIEIKF